MTRKPGFGLLGHMPSNLAWRIEGRLIVAMHGFKGPTNVEWEKFLNAGLKHGMGSHLRILIISHGGGPDGDQRRRLAEVIGPDPALTAVMTRSALVRGITTAMSFFNRHMIGVDLGDTDAAYKHLGLDSAERSRVQQIQRELALELGLEWRAGAR